MSVPSDRDREQRDEMVAAAIAFVSAHLADTDELMTPVMAELEQEPQKYLAGLAALSLGLLRHLAAERDEQPADTLRALAPALRRDAAGPRR